MEIELRILNAGELCVPAMTLVAEAWGDSWALRFFGETLPE